MQSENSPLRKLHEDCGSLDTSGPHDGLTLRTAYRLTTRGLCRCVRQSPAPIIMATVALRMTWQAWRRRALPTLTNCPTGKSLRIYRNGVKPGNQKYFCFSETQIRRMVRPSHPSEGRRPSSRTL